MVSIFDKFAKKYFEEALRDFERAKRALSFNDYPQAIFYAQQSVEKAVKAMLEARKKVVYNHGPELISLLIDVFREEWSSELDIVVEALEYLTEYYTRSRYPFLLRGEVISPSDIINADIAKKGLMLAEKALDVVDNVLKRKGVI
ncbi:MAG: HEPN domain-containing protein [Thermoproteales archaeon]|nr:HEPN domain-containing protein [Thermoproteales archaeon]RLE63855.1 MAG: DNA-binding protein [Thermoprotei archaeon]